MKNLFFVLLLIPCLSFAAKNIDSKGGGGGSVVACYNLEGELKSVELLDIYEGRAKGLKFPEYSADVVKELEAVAFKMKKDEDRAQHFLKTFTRIIPSFRAIPRDAELELIQDAWPVFLPRGCKMKQLANYYNDMLIWYDEVLYERMDNLNKLALVVHEALYAEERITGVSDSRYARVLTAYALSEEDPFTRLSFESSTHTCGTYDGKTYFRATPLSDKENLWKFSFIRINGHYIYSEKTVTIKLGNSPLSQHEDDSLPDGWENENGGPVEIPRFSTGILDSKINPNEIFTVLATPSLMRISWKGTDPKDSFSEVEIKCSTLIDIFE